jgi:transcriptional regulator with XRE-family HTH domain
MPPDNALGDHLRARRAALRPADVGLPADDGGRRRVAGLRREEVARLAGISPDYYLRLEQGRERHPSAQVLTAIARALRLTGPAEEHLQRLVRPLPERGEPPAPDRLTTFVRDLPLPAFAHDRVLEVIAANAAATALSPAFRPGVNLLRVAFGETELTGLYRNWAEMTARLVSYLRAQAATPPHDPRLDGLVRQLSATSPRFAELWARHDVGAAASGTNQLRHPVLGDLEVDFERLCFAGTDYPVVVVYHARPGSSSAAALGRLGANPLPASQARQASATSGQPESSVSE